MRRKKTRPRRLCAGCSNDRATEWRKIADQWWCDRCHATRYRRTVVDPVPIRQRNNPDWQPERPSRKPEVIFDRAANRRRAQQPGGRYGRR
jgi:hypothetical protein